ncbi:MAG: multiprotein bridging factor aMBF1 [Candidatus Bathyarchaeia archaeon]|nr:TIGR00270 family protein [Candidatus Bathyarchaeota archaeon]
MRCEVCGRKIHSKPVKALIEGAKLTVCNECAKHGTILMEEPKQPQALQTKPKIKVTPAPHKPRTSTAVTVEPSLELIDDYDVRIRQAREKMGLTHEELGKRINEKVSVLKKVETRKIKPDDKLAAKLEHALRIKLLVPVSEEKIQTVAAPKQSSPSLTIGDLIRFNKEKTEEKA